jgi:molybdopterin-guanine dinucleotide biosynthesis protein A
MKQPCRQTSAGSSLNPDHSRLNRRQFLTRTATGAVAQHTGGFEPLAAFYPCSALPLVASQLESGDHRLRSLVAALVEARHVAAVSLPARPRPQLANWNSPSDVTELEA